LGLPRLTLLKFTYDRPMGAGMRKMILFARVRKSVTTLVQSIHGMFCRSVRKSVSDKTEQAIEEFERLSGSGNSNGWRFDRKEIHER